MTIQRLPGRAIEPGTVTVVQLDSAIATAATTGGGPKITNIQVTDNTYTVLDDTAVDTAGGYIRITGTGFVAGCQVLINNIPAASTTFVSATEVRAQVPATAAGTYVVYLVNTDGGVAIRVNGITFSATPTWVTGGALSGTNNVAISIQLSATLAATYSLAAGSTLPTGLTLTSGGLLSGTITGLTQETVYSFTIVATDTENQDSPRTFTLTITVADPYYELVTLHLPGNGANGATNNTFLDGSTNNFTIARNGNTTQGTFSPFSQTGWANYTTSGNAFRFPDSADFSMGTNAFTVEAFVYVTKTQSVGASIVSQWISGNDNNSSWMIGCHWGGGSGGTKFEGTISIGGTVTLVTDTVDFALNTWHHVVLARSGSPGTLALFVNGVRKATATPTGSIVDATNPVGIGIRGGNDSYYGDGIYISNVRIVNGTDVYGVANSTIPVPTAPLTAITNTKLLTCQSNRFVDTNTQVTAKTPTFVGSPSVQAFSPFNPTLSWSAAAYGGSGYFDGNGDYLSTPNVSALQPGTSTTAFSVECWIYPTSSGSERGILGNYKVTSYPTNTDGFDILWGNAQTIAFRWGYPNYADSGSGPTVALNTWNHIAVCRNSSGSLSCFLNGTRWFNTSSNTNITNATAASFWVGWAGSLSGTTINPFPGYIAGVKFLKNATAYDPTLTTLTVPTSPPTSDANTSLLLNFTNAGIYDATSKNDLETVGDAKISTAQSRWGGSSMAFDGTGDGLLATSNPNFDFGTGNFTIEMWINFANVTSTWQAIISRAYGVAGGWRLYKNNGDNQLRWYDNSTSVVLTTGSTLANNTWSHIAVVRNSGTTAIYIDGVSRGSASNTTSYNPGNYALEIGRGVVTSEYPMTGYIQDLRITRGYARYTSNFTVPSSAFPTT